MQAAPSRAGAVRGPPVERRSIEQRASARLLSAPASVPDDMAPPDMSRRVQQAQDNLQQADAWAYELFRPAQPQPDLDAEELNNKLREWQARSDQGVTEMTLEHAKLLEVHAAQRALIASEARARKGATQSSLADDASAREEAHPALLLRHSAPALSRIANPQVFHEPPSSSMVVL